MVKVYDPESGDVVDRLISAVFKRERRPRVDPAVLRRWIAEELARAYGQTPAPSIALKARCLELPGALAREEYFPARFVPERNTVELCANFVGDRATLAENLRREFAFERLTRGSAFELREVVDAYFTACRESLAVYFSDPALLSTGAAVCARYVVKYREFNPARLPFDQFCREVNELVREREQAAR